MNSYWFIDLLTYCVIAKQKQEAKQSNQKQTKSKKANQKKNQQKLNIE
jgi:hypothetical protein